MDLTMSMKRDQQIQANPVPLPGIPMVSSVAKTTRPSCEQDGFSERTKIMRYSGPDLPEDIWCHIHALLPLPDAARAGCVSREFLRCWRCHPNLTFGQETLGVNLTFFERVLRLTCGRDKLALKFTEIVDQIMKKHTCIGVKTLKLQCCGSRIYTSRLKSWLKIAVNPQLEELVLSLPVVYDAKYYNFPCPLLFNGTGKSISYLELKGCAFHPMAGLGCLRKLHLSQVQITGDDLGCLLSNSFVLEELNLWRCNKITCLKIPSLLNQFNHLTVSGCKTLEVIDNKAPNLRTVRVDTTLVRLPFGDSLRVKNLEMLWPFEYNLVYYACAELPRIMPNLETLGISSAGEVLNTPNLPAKFLHLKVLEICLDVAEGAFSPAYDYLSLAFLLDACPVLETFALSVCQTRMKHDSVSGDCSLLRKMPGRHHVSIKNVKIDGFCSAKSMIELTCHILDSATSLKNLTLDTIYDDAGYEHVDRLAAHEIGGCSSPTGKCMVREAHKAVLAIEKYIMGKVPSNVKLNIKKPCSQCHSVK